MSGKAARQTDVEAAKTITESWGGISRVERTVNSDSDLPVRRLRGARLLLSCTLNVAAIHLRAVMES